MNDSQTSDSIRPNELAPGIVPPSAAAAILTAVEGLRYGQVTIIVHDGRVLQIDRMERIRLNVS